VSVKKEPKAVCLVPGLLEWMNKLDLQDYVIGIGKDCRDIAHKKDLPVVGSFFNLDTNAIKKMQPDVVLALTTIDKYVLEWMINNKYNIVLFTFPKSMKDVYTAVELLGNVFDKSERANKVLTQYKEKINTITQNGQKKQARGYYSIRFNDKLGEDMAASGEHILGNLMEIAGITNLAKNKGDMIYHRDDIIKDNPDYVFLDIRQKEDYANKEPYKSLSAVKNNKLIGIHPNLITAYSPKYIEVIKIMTEAIK